MNAVDVAQLANDAPIALRVGIGALGSVILVAGARLYKLALFGGAFAIGAVAAALGLVWGGAWVPALLRPEVVGLGALFAGALTAGTVRLAHRLGLLAIGGLTGLAAGAAVGGFLAGPAVLWGPLAGGVVGALVFPWLYEALLRFLTPFVGAVCIAYASGRPDQLWLLGVLWGFGVLVQVGLFRSRGEESDGD